MHMKVTNSKTVKRITAKMTWLIICLQEMTSPPSRRLERIVTMQMTRMVYCIYS